jgi:hypothetical protein
MPRDPQVEEEDDDEDDSGEHPQMPPPNLGDPGADDSGNGGGTDSSSSTSDSTLDSGDSSEESNTDDEVGDDNPTLMGLLEGDVAFEIPFRDKLRSFGLSEFQANLIVLNGATSPNVFARLFTRSALDALFEKEHLDDLRILVVERVKMFHRWLNERHVAGESLIHISLAGFTDQVMATLVEADSRGSATRVRDEGSSKGTGLTLPTFNGTQSQYKVWSQKWRAYLGTMKNADGIPLLYVIVHAKKEKSSVRHQIKGASLKGSQFDTDNFKVSQLLESALADGSASIFTTTHAGDGRSAYLDLDKQYAGAFRKETRVQEIMSKLKTLQYRGAKSFPWWDKFTNVLINSSFLALRMLL